MWSRAEGTEDAQQFGAGRGLAATFILREHASQEALPPEVVAVLIARIGRTISIENRLGITISAPQDPADDRGVLATLRVPQPTHRRHF
jgi:hypothetical protein